MSEEKPSNDVSAIDKFQETFDKYFKSEDHGYDKFKNFLLEFKPLENLNNDVYLSTLIEDFADKIVKEENKQKRNEEYQDFIKEIKCHLSRKTTIELPKKELDRRISRIKKIKKEIKQINKKIKKLEAKDLGMDDLNEEKDNVIMEISKYSKRFWNLWKTLKELENKMPYTGLNDINLCNLTDDKELNKAINDKVMPKFKKTGVLPDYTEVSPLIPGDLDRKKEVFESLILLFKEQREKEINRSLNYYLEEDQTFVEPDDLREKLDKQNNFHEQLKKLEDEFKKKIENVADDENDGTSDTETDSQDQEDGELETVSSAESEFQADEDDDEDVDDEEDDKVESSENEEISNLKDLVDETKIEVEEMEDNVEQTEASSTKRKLVEDNLNDDETKKLKQSEEADKEAEREEDDCIVLD